MPAPTSVNELLERLRKSGLVPADRLEGFVAGLQTSGAPLPATSAMLDRLVNSGMITRFHADKLAAGKYKGFHLGSYLILDQLGAGGMGQVYLAEHAHMRRLVALKVLNPHAFENDPVARERFFREARAAGTLDHPNIVRVFDLCQEGKILYFVMEYVEGISLQSLVSQHKPLEVTTACHYIRQIAFGLQHAHDMGFIHRDIKPANLLVDRTGVVKILDLGLVRSEADAASMLTKQLDNKNILGTADYVAPEQAVDSSRVDVRADIYSLGATLYFLLAGRPLFPEGRTAQKLVWQQIKEPVPITRLRPDVPPALAEIIHRMLQKRPADRFARVADVFDALNPFDSEEIAPPGEQMIPEPPPRIAMVRAATPGPSAPRAAGSTSQIVVAAMRTNPAGSSAAIRKDRDEDSGNAAAVPNRTPLPIPASQSPTESAQADDTQRTPSPQQPLSFSAANPVGPTTLLITLSIALILSLVGIVILLLTK